MVAALALMAMVSTSFVAEAPATAADSASLVTVASPRSTEPVMQPEYPSTDFIDAAAELEATQAAAIERDLDLTAAEYLARAEAALDAAEIVALASDRGFDAEHLELQGTRVVVTVDNEAELQYWTDRGLDARVGEAPPLPEPISMTTALDLRGGDAIYFGGLTARCSVGVNGTDVNGAPQLLTAGHCGVGSAGDPYYARSIASPGFSLSGPLTLLGTKVAGSFRVGNGFDSGLVAVTSGLVETVPLVTTYGYAQGAPTSSTPLALRQVVSADTLATGTPICKSGATTGWTCGEIEYLIQGQVIGGGGSPSYVADGIITTACMLGGDSGGPAVVGSALVALNSATAFGGTDQSTAAASCATTPLNKQISFMFAMQLNTVPWGTVQRAYLQNWEPTMQVDEPIVATPAFSAVYNPDESVTISGSVPNHVPASTVGIRVGPTWTSTSGTYPDGTWSQTIPASAFDVGGAEIWLVGRWGANSTSDHVIIPTVDGTTWGAPFSVDASFVDVVFYNQFYWEIAWLAQRGVSTGYADGTFRPLGTVNRDAMAAFLYRSAGSPEFTAPAVSPFSDVSTSNQFYREIAWLASTGITTGYPDGTFRPLAPVARDAMAAFLYRFAGEPAFSAPSSSPFIDMATSTQFYEEVTWLRSTGISTGYTDGTYRPLAAVARDAMAAFLYRFDYSGLQP